MSREYHLALQSRGRLALPAELRKRHHLDEPGAQVRVVERDRGDRTPPFGRRPSRSAVVSGPNGCRNENAR